MIPSAPAQTERGAPTAMSPLLLVSASHARLDGRLSVSISSRPTIFSAFLFTSTRAAGGQMARSRSCPMKLRLPPSSQAWLVASSVRSNVVKCATTKRLNDPSTLHTHSPGVGICVGIGVALCCCRRQAPKPGAPMQAVVSQAAPASTNTDVASAPTVTPDGQAAQNRFCQQCGAPQPAGKFCDQCGAPLDPGSV